MAYTQIQVHDPIDIRADEPEPILWPECCIYKVPESLYDRKGKRDSFTPQLISIGPIHHGKKKLKPMDAQKRRYFHSFLQQLSNKNFLMEDYKAYLEREEEQIRRCYSVKFPRLNAIQFVKMMMFDAVFIMELFLRNYYRRDSQKDYMFDKSWLERGTKQDLLLLENQLPISVLHELHNKVVIRNQPEISADFIDLACIYFYDYYPKFDGGRKPVPPEDKHWYMQSKHFTDLIRYFFVTEKLRPHKPPKSGALKPARKLDKAGITFEKVIDRNLGLVEFERHLPIILPIPYIKYAQARFQIPPLLIDDRSDCVWRNLVALEQCHYGTEDYICNYLSLINALIDLPEDVDFLVDRQILEHHLASDAEAAALLSSFVRNVVLNSNCYSKLIDDVNRHYDNKWNKTMATLNSVYFSDLWRGSSTVVGLAVLFFTFFNFFSAIF